MIRRALGYLHSYFCNSEDRFFFTLDGAARISVIAEMFKAWPGASDFTVRLTIHDKTALTAFINDPHGSIELEVHPATARAFSQFLLRRLREEATKPAAVSDDRQSEEENYDAEKKVDWRRNIYVQDGGPR